MAENFGKRMAKARKAKAVREREERKREETKAIRAAVKAVKAAFSAMSLDELDGYDPTFAHGRRVERDGIVALILTEDELYELERSVFETKDAVRVLERVVGR